MVPTEINFYISILLSSLIYQTSHVTSTDFPLDIISHLCPYTDFCHTKASQVFQDPKFAPCCSNCSCEDSCLETQRCCPDMLHFKNKTTNLVCKSTMVRKLTTMVASNSLYYIPRYFITDKCPYTEKDEVIRKACTGEFVSSLQDLIWVSDTTTGKIYQNRHCALCHHVKHWQNWNIRSSSCTDFLNATVDKLAHVLFSSDCILINEVPESQKFNVEKYRCFIPDTFVCNQTGLWQQYDARIAEGCQMYNGWFFEVGLLHVTIHKNPYCYLCNKDSQTHTTSRCQLPPSGSRGIKVSFNALFNFMETQHADTPNFECASNEMQDKYTDRCRTLICPFGSVPFNGKCKPLALEMNNVGLQIRFRLEVIGTNTELIAVAHNLTLFQANGKKLVETLWRALGLKRCLLCTARLSTENNGRLNMSIMDLFAILQLQTKSDCLMATVFEKVAKVQNKKLEVDLSARVNLALSVHIAKDSHTRNDDVFLFHTGVPTPCQMHLKITKIPCPEIELRYDEVTSYDDETVKLSLASWFNNVHGLNDTMNAQICVHDYLRVMSLGNGSPPAYAEGSLFLSFVLVTSTSVLSAGAGLK